jgi:hypothetical protein
MLTEVALPDVPLDVKLSEAVAAIDGRDRHLSHAEAESVRGGDIEMPGDHGDILQHC